MRFKINDLIQYFILINIFFVIFAQDLSSEIKIDYRAEMRGLVELISSRARTIRPGFIVVPQNAMELVTNNGKPDGKIVRSYLSAIDGTGCEELFYGHRRDGIRNSANTTQYFLNYLLLFRKYRKCVLVIDYVKTRDQASDSFSLSVKYGFISFQARRQLEDIPAWIFNKNDNAVSICRDARNFLYLLDASKFRSRSAYLSALKNTYHDLVVIDAFFWGEILTKNEIALFRNKPSGKRRLILAYLSIGEAEDYRYYWKREWKRNPPTFLTKENPEWKGNYKVKYWMDEWKEIICGSQEGRGFDNSYLKKILDAGFDGVYLDILDAAIYFEKKNK